jgi:hypothetical protein
MVIGSWISDQFFVVFNLRRETHACTRLVSRQ